MGNEDLHIAVVDIGKLSNLGWVIEGPSISKNGTDIDSCIEALATAMRVGPLALGFEAPMFVPYGRERCDLDKARNGEGDRAFSAGAGAAVLTKALVIVPYILGEVRRRVRDARPKFNWHTRLSPQDLLLFEAFVTHVSERSHVECARLALEKFPRNLNDRASLESAVREPFTLNLLGAILLRMGWIDDLAVLAEPCLVVRYKGSST
jgi:hypothetical protein